MDRKVKVGVIGLGDICDIYLKNLSTIFPNTEVYAVCSRDVGKARKKADEYGVANVCSYDEMMKNEQVEIILNITNPQNHHRICRDALVNGKHVYVEKPLALTAEDGRELVRLAEEKELLLGVAPDTFLGTGIQTAIHVIESGMIGELVGASAFLQNHGHENWHPNPEFFYEKGGGPMFDMGPYYLTALVAMMGEIEDVQGMSNKAFIERMITSQPKYGKKIPVEVPTNVYGLLRFKCGAIANIVTSNDVWGSKAENIEVHGTKGSMLVPDPNGFGGEVWVKCEGGIVEKLMDVVKSTQFTTSKVIIHYFNLNILLFQKLVFL